MAKKIMIAGFGSAGGFVLDYLVRTPGIEKHEIIIATRSIAEAGPRVNTTAIAGGIAGSYPKLSLVACDLNDIDSTASLLSAIRPDIIAYTGRFIKGVKYGQFSYPNGIGYGAWIPLSLPLIYALMKAVKKSGIDTKVINSSFPDGVCPALASSGLAPFCGAGNLNHLIPRIKTGLADRFRVRPSEIDVTMIGSHFLNTYVSRDASAMGSPYYMNCIIGGKRVTSLSDEEIFRLSIRETVSGPQRNAMIASDIVEIIKALLDGSGSFIHVPGPNGLPGGYPCRVYRDRIELALPEGMSEGDAVAINKSSLAFDGIEDTTAGSIVFTDDIRKKMKTVFGLDYPKKLALEDCENFAIGLRDVLLARASGK